MCTGVQRADSQELCPHPQPGDTSEQGANLDRGHHEVGVLTSHHEVGTHNLP